MDGAAKDTDGVQKRNSLEDLNKEDLIKKYKSLLIIAQRAKQAKDEAGEEVIRLKEQLNTLQIQVEQSYDGKRKSDAGRDHKELQLQNEVSAMKEMLGTLTEQKLTFTMEVDKLKKENESLEKQLNQLKVEKANIWETSARLQSQLEELETSAESYKRQTHRLTDENEALIQQMETLEIEMKKKEDQTSQLSRDQVKLIEGELLMLRDEVERLTEEDARKKEQMKQMYETFSNEKSELKKCLETERNKIQNLFEDIQIISKEKERFLIDIKNVEENNIELQKLVAGVHAERDSLALHCGKLNEEKERIEKQLESGKVEKKIVTDENAYLKLENQRLNHHLDNANKELNIVRNENNLLKLEKQQFNEKLHSVLNDREKLTSELQHAECQLQDILHQTRSNLQHYEVLKFFTNEKEVDDHEEDEIDDGDSFYKQNSSLSNIISSLDKSLTQFFSLKTGELNSVHDTLNECNNQVEQEAQANVLSYSKNGIHSVFLCGEPNYETRISTDIVSKGKDDLRKLYSELKLLNMVISNLEVQGELLQTENTKLRESMNCLMKLNSEGILSSQENCLEALLRNSRMVMVGNSSEDGDINMLLKKESARDVVQLQKELDICQESVEVKTLEIGQLRKKLEEQFAQFSETDSDLRNELDCCRQTLSKKVTELGVLQEELAFVLGRQCEFGTEDREMDRICSKMTQSRKCSEGKIGELDSAKDEISVLYEQQHNSQLEIEKSQDELKKMTEAFVSMSTLMKSLTGEKMNLELNVDRLQNELTASKESKAYLESCLDSLHKEKAGVEQELASIKQELLLKSAGIEELKEKEVEVAYCKSDTDDTVMKLDGKIHEVRQEFSDKFLLERSSTELEELKKQITQYERDKTDLINENTKLNNLLVDFKSVVDQNALCMRSKNSEIEAIKEDTTKVDGEWIKLYNEFEEKCRLLNKKVTMIRSIRQSLVDVNISFKTARDELLKNEAQNYKFLFDEKCREADVAKQELEQMTLNSIRNSEEASTKASSEFQATLEMKGKESESLKITLQQAQSNIAQTLIMLKDLEGELLNVQNHYGSLKTEFSDLSNLLDTRTLELSNLHLSFEEKCSELDSVKKVSQNIASEHEILNNKLVQSGLTYMKAENDLKEQLDVTSSHYNNSVKELETLRKEMKQYELNKIHLQNELVDIQEQYSRKIKELEFVAKELHCLQSQFIQTQEELKTARNQHDDVLKELKYVKNELQLANDKHRGLEEELTIAKNCSDEKNKEVENLTSELVNVQNTSAETVDNLIAVTAELDTVKDVHLMTKRKLDEVTEQLRDVTIKFTVKEEELKDSLKQLEETRQASNSLHSKAQQVASGLVSLSSGVSELNALRMKLSEDVQTLHFNVLNTLQKDVWIGMQKVVTNYVESEIAVAKRENAELLGEMNEMNQVLKQRGETISKLKELNSELEQRFRETNSKLEKTQKDLKIKLSEMETKDKALCNLEINLAEVTKAQQESIHAKDETIFTLEKEIVKFMECQHELETKTAALEVKEERIHNLEAELTKQAGRLQELESKDKIIHNFEEQIKVLKAKAENRGDDGSSTEDHNMRIKELEDEISTLKARIQLLEHETEEMRRENGDVPSEVMSSSTISRAEESARLKDLEETFEERYTKLRTVAVRLKKRVSEMTMQQTQQETEKKKLATDKADLQAKVAQLSAHAKNLQSLQLEYDRLQDDIETQKSEVKELTKALEHAINESAALKFQLLECQEEKECKVKDLEGCIKDKQKLELANKELNAHIHSLKKEKEAENISRKEQEKEVKRLEDELKAGEKKLAEEIDHHKITQEQLEASRQECKKHSVLSLEMEDYERSVADLTQQLALEKSKLKELDNHLETQRDISRGLQEQISLLEQRIQSEEARSKDVKDQLNASRARLLEVEAVALEREASLSELVSQIEQHKDKNENLVLQLSELAAEKQRLVESGRNQQDGLTKQVHVLEEHVSRLKESLAEREAELGDLRSEFGNYKVRAQSVLRQKARLDDGSSSFIREDHIEEVAQLRQTAEILRSKLEDTSSKLQTLSVENSAVQEDRARVLQRCQELLGTVQDLRNLNSQLHTQLKETTTEHREALRSQKLQAETLNQCYKQQLEELEEKLQKETSSLKKQLQDAEEQLHGTHKLSSVVSEVIGHVIQPAESNMVLSTPSKHSSSPHWNSSTEGFIPVQSAVTVSQQDMENKLEITLLKREEGEGSESIDSASPHLSASQERRTEVIPLDKLLSSPSDDDNNVSTDGASPGVELGQTKEELVVSECRIRHLTGLLSEAERDLAKLTQQNQVLKEEIRRQQRSVEREQHAQNFEYLKNVILKFVTLQGGDERSRLVPVLNTILKLSPEETNQLNIVAKGGTDLQGGGRGWGSYLHLWAGTQ